MLWRQTTPSAAHAVLARHIATYARSLGANSMSVNFLVSVDGLTGNRAYAGPETPTPASLRQILAAAKAEHLRVALRPLVDETNIPRPQWRGTLRPTSPAQWFSSYGRLMGTYARLAQATCSAELVVGAELSSLQSDDAGWMRVLADVRAAGYRGDVTYAANWDRPASLPFAPRSGVDFYPKLAVSNAVSTPRLTAAMVAAFQKMPASFLASLVVQETGLSAYGGKFSFPSLWNPGSAPSFEQQARWFTAACDAARAVKAQGLYYWGLDSGTDPLQPDPNTLGTFAFVTRPAADAARRCFAQPW